MSVLKRLRELHEKATAGPWGSAFDGDVHRIGPRECDVCIVEGAQGADEDAAFIAAARNALPKLLAEREEMRRELEEVRAGSIRMREERDHYRNLVLAEHPKELAAQRDKTSEIEAQIKRLCDFTADDTRALAEERAIVKWTCPTCREPWDGEGAWPCRECFIELHETQPVRVPLAQLERDTARARVETLEAALRMLSDLDCYSRQQSHPVARMKGRLRHWHKTGQCVSCAARAALEGKAGTP